MKSLSSHRSFEVLILSIILLTIISTVTGLFYTTGGISYTVTNIYGDLVRIYGDGIYAFDSFLKAPIFRGSDLTMLVVGVPLLIVAFVIHRKKNTLRRQMFLTSVLSVFLYYSANIVFGVTYNALFLVYVALFACSLFALLRSIQGINFLELESNDFKKLPFKGVKIFLGVSGVALIVAWLPDIASALIAGRTLALIEVYTTEITYILDMGIISPLAFIGLSLINKRKGMGFVILEVLLMICMIIGMMLPVQTLLQVLAGIEIPLPVLITKIGIFVVLALFAGYYHYRLIKALKD